MTNCKHAKQMPAASKPLIFCHSPTAVTPNDKIHPDPCLWQTIPFPDLPEGSRFWSTGAAYVKLPKQKIPRYGWINALGPPFYDGDSGHRYFYDHQSVWIQCPNYTPE